MPASPISALDGFRVRNDRSINLNTIAVRDFGIQFRGFAEDADFLALQIDLRKNFEQLLMIDDISYRAAVGNFQLQPDLFFTVVVCNTHVHDFYLFIV